MNIVITTELSEKTINKNIAFLRVWMGSGRSLERARFLREVYVAPSALMDYINQRTLQYGGRFSGLVFHCTGAIYKSECNGTGSIFAYTGMGEWAGYEDVTI